MSTEIRWRRGTTAEHSTFTGAPSEVTVDTDKNTLVVHDGATPGGFPLASESASMYKNIYDPQSIEDDSFDLSVHTGSLPQAQVTNLVSDLAGKVGVSDKNVFTKTQVWSKGADVASAAALTLGDDGNYFDVTGTTAITSIATVGVGTVIKLHFDGALTLTHHSTDLVLPGGANRIVSAGDEVELIEYATGDWRLTKHTRNVIPGWEPIASFSFNNTPSADIINLSGFQSLRLTGHFLPVNDGVKLLLRTSTNNGTSYQDGASSYSQQFDRGSLSITNAGNGTASGVELTLGSDVGQVTTEGVQINIVVNNLNVAARQTWVNGTIHLTNAAGNPIAGVVGGRRVIAELNNAVRLLFETGNISTGNLFVEGLRG